MQDPQILTIRLDQITVDTKSDPHRVSLDLRYLPRGIPELTDIALECLSHIVPISVRNDSTKRVPDRYSLISGFRTYQLLCLYWDVSSPCMVHCYQKIDAGHQRCLQVMDMSFSKLLNSPNGQGISVLAHAMLPGSPLLEVMQELVHIGTNDDRSNLLDLSRRRFQEVIQKTRQAADRNLAKAGPAAQKVGLDLSASGSEDDDEYQSSNRRI